MKDVQTAAVIIAIYAVIVFGTFGIVNLIR